MQPIGERSSRVPAPRAAAYRSDGLWDNRRLSDGIEAAAILRPDALAVADNEERLTYFELGQRVTGAISALGDQGVRPVDGVVLIGGNTVDTVVVYHALLRAGVPLCLLDRRCGRADVSFARDALGTSARVILPSAERARLHLGHGASPPLLLEALGATAVAGTRLGEADPDRDTPAVVLFTSGTTSRPKAVMHSLNTLTAGASNMAQITASQDDAVIFLVSPVTSITGVIQMHLFADRHAALVLEDQFEAERSLDRVNTVGATVLGGAPVIAERLLRAAAASPDRRIALRTLALGGAMLPRPLLELATDDFGIEIARVYGSSEAPCATGSLPADGRERRLLDDGAFMPGTEVRVGSSNHPSEGMVRGPSVFLGYVDADDNAATFEDDWYRTGDLIEVDNGRLSVIGRLKEVVNRNGLKISLHEIDDALAGMAGIIEHACFAVPDPETGERLVVAILPEADTQVSFADVVAHLAAKGTARRKLPEQLVIWDGPLPRTTSGKVVRSRLVMEAPGRPTEMAERLRADG